MKLNVYSVHDLKAETYQAPALMVNDAVAKRAFKNECNDGRFKDNPEDFYLWHLGTWDQATAEFNTDEARGCLCNGLTMLSIETTK